MGCHGGWLDEAWNFLVYTSIPTDKCVSYKSGDGGTKQYPAKCDDGSAIQTYKIKISKRVDGISAMKEEIMRNGPVEVGFTVYQDFMSYKSGIYKHSSGGILGGHAVKAVGWELRMEQDTGLWPTHGTQSGMNKDISELLRKNVELIKHDTSESQNFKSIISISSLLRIFT